MKFFLTLVMLASAALAQDAIQSIYFYTAGGYLEYVCEARSSTQGPASVNSVTVSSVSNASPAVVTATAHGFDYQSLATVTPIVKITGASGGWAGLNGVWIATPTGANTFTVPVDTSGFGTFSGQSITVTTYAARTTSAVWRVRKYVYNASNQLIFSGYGAASAGAGSSALIASANTFTNICANRATLAYQ